MAGLSIQFGTKKIVGWYKNLFKTAINKHRKKFNARNLTQLRKKLLFHLYSRLTVNPSPFSFQKYKDKKRIRATGYLFLIFFSSFVSIRFFYARKIINEKKTTSKPNRWSDEEYAFVKIVK